MSQTRGLTILPVIFPYPVKKSHNASTEFFLWLTHSLVPNVDPSDGADSKIGVGCECRIGGVSRLCYVACPLK